MDLTDTALIVDEAREDAMDAVLELLSECRFTKNRTYPKAAKALALMERFSFTDLYLQHRGLVVYPDLLQRYLKICTELGSDDFSAMVSRCIEHPMENWAEPSLDLLLAFYKEHPDRVRFSKYSGNTKYLNNAELSREIMQPQIMNTKYSIGIWLYNKAKNAGLVDKYYEATKNGKKIPYTHPGPLKMESDGFGYGGYRHAYHLLQYGGQRRMELIERWKKWGPDCTFEAACDFLNLPHEALQERVSYLVGQLPF